MKVLMLGWEFPPHSSGGLGTACQGLTKGLSHKGAAITFVLPKYYGPNPNYLNIVSTDSIELKNVKFKTVNSTLRPYQTPGTYQDEMKKILFMGKSSKQSAIYGNDLFDEVNRYSQRTRIIAQNEDFDIIHAHDWMTFKAGINAKKEKNVPLVVHVHATEFDRTGGHPNQYVYDIEREGMHHADSIIAVSNFTKQKIIENYGIAPSKVKVVHNAVEFNDDKSNSNSNDSRYLKSSTNPNHHANKFNVGMTEPRDKKVLFLGRVTLQKGPDYFLYAAKKVLDVDPHVKFIVAGTGDMMPFMIEKAASLGISKDVLFAGFLSGEEVDRAYKMADLYVMPSVSEPFGITPLEAMRNSVPVLISKQSGVSEVLSNCLKVDFWDIDDTANKIIAALNYGSMHTMLKENGNDEVKKMSWDNSADKCIEVYNELLNK